MDKTPLHIIGMHGMGDNIHQRAVIRQLLPLHDIYLETTWPQIYWDMPEVKCVNKGTTLRTQLKNAQKNQDSFYHGEIPRGATLKVSYSPAEVRRDGGVLAAMMNHAKTDPTKADFSFRPKPEWLYSADDLIESFETKKPILFYRPLNERSEWGGCKNRNPDYQAYAQLLTSIRKDYFVVSVADIVPDREWIVGHDIQADAEFHNGELSFELVAALISRSALVYSSPGFAIVMARSMGIPAVCVFGGYENSSSFSIGSGKYLGIDPVEPCNCFSHSHKCKKKIDLEAAEKQLKEFIHVPTSS